MKTKKGENMNILSDFLNNKTIEQENREINRNYYLAYL